MLITARQKYLDVERVDISAVFRNTNVIKSGVHVTSFGLIAAPRPLSLGCPSSPVGPPESLRVLQHLDVPCDVPLDSPQPQQVRLALIRGVMR